MTSDLRPIVVLAAIPCLGFQAVEHVVEGALQEACFADEVAVLADVDLDGHADFAVGVWEDPCAGPRSGRVVVYSGATGNVLFEFCGESGADLGRALAGADVNGDGYEDILCGGPRASSTLGASSGLVRVYSGVDGSTLHEFRGPQDFAEYGRALDGLGDIDGDGADEFAVLGRFEVFVVSGAQGSVLYSVPSLEARVLANAGDVDGSGGADLVLGAETAHGARGLVIVLDGATGGVLYRFRGAELQDRLGVSVDGAGDVNADGFADVIVGAIENRPGPHPNATIQNGHAKVFSGSDGELLYTIRSELEDTHAYVVAGIGDVNADGFSDVAVGAPRHTLGARGVVRVYSGDVGREIGILHDKGPDPRIFGFSLDGGHDVSGDGVPDVIVGDPASSDAGKAIVFEGACLSSRTYCVATPNSAGPGAMIRPDGLGSVVDDEFGLRVDGGPPSSTSLMLVGTAPSQVPFGEGFRCVAGTVERLQPPRVIGATGSVAWDFVLGQAGSAQAADTRYFQLWYRDSGGGGSGFNLSDSLSVTFCE